MAVSEGVDGGSWGRQRLRVVLGAVLVVAVVLLAGLVYAVTSAVDSDAQDDVDIPAAETLRSAAGTAQGAGLRDEIAARPMLDVRPEDARGGRPATTRQPVIVVPTATRTGAADVDTGFPQTPQGAVGQLAAIDVAVLQAMSIPHAHAVYDAWALPGGVGAAGWELTRNVQAFLGRDGVGQAKAVTTTVVATPAAAQVKGTDGTGWVLACVLFDVRAVILTQARIGYGHCERMQWADSDSGGGDGRWMIAPGVPPSRAPSTWPGTDLSVRAGWRAWTISGTR